MIPRAPAALVSLMLAAVVLLPAAGDAQELSRTLRLSVDNDSFNFWQPPRQRSDQNYTHGMRLTWDIVRVPKPGRAVVCRDGQACGATLELGQEIYTPTRDSFVHVAGERPYAGWLYGRLDVRGGTNRRLRTIGLTVGVTGPGSLAEAAQKALHRAVESFKDPVGWGDQLPTELSFAGLVSQSDYMPLPGRAGRYVDAVPTMSASAGTWRTSVSAGARARVGTQLPHPWLTEARPTIGAYGFAGVRGEVVARDLFLDGTLFRKSVSTDHRPLVGEVEAGGGLLLGALTCEYRVVRRSPQYDASPPSHTFSSINLTWRLR